MRKTPSSIFSSSGKSANNRKPKLAVDTQASEFSNDASFDRKAVGILSLGHLFNDLAQGTIPAMLPYLISAHDLSYESAARLVLSSTLCSSVLQPLFGWLSDTGRLKIALAPLGLALCGVTTGLLGLLTDYQTLLICTAIGGIGNAAFHPDGGRMTNYVSGKQKTTGMGFFALGGNVGYSLAPVATAALFTYLGMRSTLFLIVPSLTMAYALQKRARAINGNIALERLERSASADALGHNDRAQSQENWLPFSILTLGIVTRSIVFFALVTFTPLYFIQQFHQSKADAASALTIFLLANAIATIGGGKLADMIGERKVLLTASALLPLMLVLFLARNSAALALLMLAAAGLCAASTVSATIVMGQRYLEKRVGLASGITMGLAGSIGGMAVPYFGRIADTQGIHSALEQSVVFSVVSLALMFAVFVVEDRQIRAQSR